MSFDPSLNRGQGNVGQKRIPTFLRWLFLVDKDFDNPFEDTVKKGLAFTGVDLRFAFGFERILPVFPLERFKGNKVEIQAFLKFRGVGILDECDGALACFCDVGGGENFTRKTTGMPDVWVVRRQFRCGCDTDAFDGNICFVVFHFLIIPCGSVVLIPS